MVKFFGLPINIVSDRENRFLVDYGQHLFSFMGIDLKFSSSNHQQINGQTERIDHLLKEYLRQWAKEIGCITWQDAVFL